MSFYPPGVSALSPLVMRDLAESENFSEGNAIDLAQEFGAKGDDTTDDAAALNAMFSAVRTSSNTVSGSDSSLDRYGRYVIDGGGRNYAVGTSLNATGIRNNAGNVTFRNFNFIWKGTTGKAVIDLTHSVHTSWENCHIWNTSSYPTAVGWQQARNSSGAVAYFHNFINCSAMGYFTKTALFNQSSEQSKYFGCRYWNFYDGANTYAAILQNAPNIAGASDYQTLQPSLDGTFQMAQFFGCEFRRPPACTTASAAALYINGPRRMNMFGCYAVSYGDNAVVMSGAGNAIFSDVYLELHNEGTFKYDFNLIDNTAITFRGFTWFEYNTQSTTSCFKTDLASGNHTFNNFHIKPVTPVLIFDNPAKYSIRDGEIKVTQAADLPTIPGTFVLYEGRTVASDRTPTTIEYVRYANSAATAGAATATSTVGIITSEALTTAAGASYTLTLTNNDVDGVDVVTCSVWNGSNTGGTPTVTTVTPGTNSIVIIVKNTHATDAFNGTIKIGYRIFKKGT